MTIVGDVEEAMDAVAPDPCHLVSYLGILGNEATLWRAALSPYINM